MIFLFLQCVSPVIIVYIIISPLNSYLYIHWILDFKYILLLLLRYIFLYIAINNNRFPISYNNIHIHTLYTYHSGPIVLIYLYNHIMLKRYSGLKRTIGCLRVTYLD